MFAGPKSLCSTCGKSYKRGKDAKRKEQTDQSLGENLMQAYLYIGQ